MAKRSIAVRISGQEYRIRSDADEARLQRVAQHLDAAMAQVRERTGTVDTLDVAILTSLNLAREVLSLRDALRQAPGHDAAASVTIEIDRIQALIALAEATVVGAGGGKPRRASSADSEVDLLSLDTGADAVAAEESLLGPLIDVATDIGDDGSARAEE